jgi:hypothetical protein
LITPRELEATDVDTSSKDLTFVITRGPDYGRLENTANPVYIVKVRKKGREKYMIQHTVNFDVVIH